MTWNASGSVKYGKRIDIIDYFSLDFLNDELDKVKCERCQPTEESKELKAAISRLGEQSERLEYKVSRLQNRVTTSEHSPETTIPR